MKSLCIFNLILIVASGLLGQCPNGYVKISDDQASSFPNRYFPQIHENSIVWSQFESSKHHVYLNSGSGPVQQSLGDSPIRNIDPTVHGSTVVWQKLNAPNDEIYKNSGSGEALVSTGTSTENGFPDICNNTIVWEGNDGSTTQIYKNTGAGQLLVSIDATVSQNFSARIDNSTIVWYGNDGTVWHIYKDTGTGPVKVSTDNTVHHVEPDVMGSTIVWSTVSIPIDTDPTKYQIYKSTSGGLPELVSTGSSILNGGPKVHGNTMVWVGWDGNNFQVYKNSGNGKYWFPLDCQAII